MTSITLSDDVRRYQVVLVNTLSEIKEALPTTAQGFVLFLAVDASAIEADTIREVSRDLLQRGCAYLSVWGRIVNGFMMSSIKNEVPQKRRTMSL